MRIVCDRQAKWVRPISHAFILDERQGTNAKGRTLGDE